MCPKAWWDIERKDSHRTQKWPWFGNVPVIKTKIHFEKSQKMKISLLFFGHYFPNEATNCSDFRHSLKFRSVTVREETIYRRKKIKCVACSICFVFVFIFGGEANRIKLCCFFFVSPYIEQNLIFHIHNCNRSDSHPNESRGKGKQKQTNKWIWWLLIIHCFLFFSLVLFLILRLCEEWTLWISGAISGCIYSLTQTRPEKLLPWKHRFCWSYAFFPNEGISTSPISSHRLICKFFFRLFFLSLYYIFFLFQFSNLK